MVELVVSDILSKSSDERAYVMLLREREGVRKILVAIGYLEAQAIAFAMKNITTKRPVTHDLFGTIFDVLGAKMHSVVVNKVEDGTFYSNLLFKVGDSEELREVDARTSDAVAIALRCAAPIYIKEELLNRVCIRDEFNGALSIPISIADTKTLQAVMRQAVEEENYELASKLKEELDSRKRESDQNRESDEHLNIE